MTKKILALTGLKGSGKSTIAKTLQKENPLFQNAPIFSFADPLKEMAKILLPTEAFLPENKEKTDHGLCGKSPRYLLQTLGTEWGRKLVGPDIWAQHMKNRLLQSTRPFILIDDLRFENEAHMLTAFPNTRIAKVQRFQHQPKDPHDSEKGLPPSFIDLTLPNRSLEDLKAICRHWDPWEHQP